MRETILFALECAVFLGAAGLDQAAGDIPMFGFKQVDS